MKRTLILGLACVLSACSDQADVRPEPLEVQITAIIGGTPYVHSFVVNPVAHDNIRREQEQIQSIREVLYAASESLGEGADFQVLLGAGSHAEIVGLGDSGVATPAAIALAAVYDQQLRDLLSAYELSLSSESQSVTDLHTEAAKSVHRDLEAET